MYTITSDGSSDQCFTTAVVVVSAIDGLFQTLLAVFRFSTTAGVFTIIRSLKNYIDMHSMIFYYAVVKLCQIVTLLLDILHLSVVNLLVSTIKFVS